MIKFNKDILTNNYRISQLIQKYNRREDYPIVDNKILTAKKSLEQGVPVPENILFIESHGQLKKKLQNLSLLESSFVVKPAEGSQGGGILIVDSITSDEDFSKAIFHTSRLGSLKLNEFKHYLSGILSGLYSLKGHKDFILVQEKISNINEFIAVTNSGIPDIRVIVLLGFPIMAMIRFPTLLSGGRGNLHLGAVGGGINLRTGQIFHSVQNNRTVHSHPDTHTKLIGLQMPLWNEVLNLAARSSEIARIGYLGVDIVIDKNKGALLLEMNARPGLSIQLANQKGLRGIINKVLKEAPPNLSCKDRVKWSVENLS
ncbi:MAG: alpha-L-glutamate ligase-like protein [Bdellovibrionaceae bacterium]|nr:alpha-L-glutamate ligase-like protein [Pseudobdellovibrionaceae bacterium]